MSFKNRVSKKVVNNSNLMAIYIRVSTDKQALTGASLDVQKAEGIKLALKYNYNFEVYEDAGFSGSLSIEERAGLLRLDGDIAENRIGAVYINKLDRLSRDDFNTNHLLKLIEEKGIKLYIGDKLTDLSDINESLLIGIQSKFAEYERKLIGARVKSAIHKRAAEGVSSHLVLPYGYTKINKMMVIDEVQAEVIRDIFHLYIRDTSCKKIADYLNEKQVPTKKAIMKSEGAAPEKYQNTVTRRGIKIKSENFRWREKSVHDIIKNTLYFGLRFYGGEYYELPELAIIGKDIYDAAQQRRKKPSTGKATHFYLLKSMLFCSKCGHKFYAINKTNNYYYMCSSNRLKGEGCNSKSIGIDYLNNLVVESVKGLPAKVSAWFERVEKADGTQTMLNANENLEAKIQTAKSNYDKAYKLFVEHAIGEPEQLSNYKRIYESYVAERSNQSDFHLQHVEILNNKENILNEIKEIASKVENEQDQQELKIILSAIIKRIFIHSLDITDRTVKIEYNLDSLTSILIDEYAVRNKTSNPASVKTAFSKDITFADMNADSEVVDNIRKTEWLDKMGYGKINKTVYKHSEDKFPEHKVMWEMDEEMDVKKDENKESDWIIE